MKLPIVDDSGETDSFDDLDRPVSGFASPAGANRRMPKSAIAGLVSDAVATMETSKKCYCIRRRFADSSL